MAVVAYTRLRMLWGGFDFQAGADHPYTSAQTMSGGANANGPNPNIGIRRCVISLDRSTKSPPLDDVQFGFSILNITNGAPDDTWITSDFTTCESIIQTFLTAVSGYWLSSTRPHRFSWYREGVGVGPPNPAVRVLDITPVGGTGSSSPPQAQQIATTVTFRTPVRRSWGRIYLPAESAVPDAGGHYGSGLVTNTATAAHNLVTTLASNDFVLGVYSRTLKTFLTAEHVEADDVPDVMRSRRPRKFVNRVILP